MYIQCLNLWQTIPRNDPFGGNYRQQDKAKSMGSPLKGGICTLKFPIAQNQVLIWVLLENACGFVKHETFTVILYQRVQTSFDMSISQFLILGEP